MIFVTGGTGLLGNNIIRELVARGDQVRALCRPATPNTALEGLNVEIIQGDLQDDETLKKSAENCQAVIHSAALIHIGWSRLSESRQVNVEGTRKVVEACLASGARLIHISTVDTLLAAESPDQPIDESSTKGIKKTASNYVVSKVEADQFVRRAISEDGLDAVIVHPGFMLGPYDWKPSSGRLMLGVAKAPIAVAPSGGCSLCDARDVASAIANAIKQGRCGQSYILAGENLTYRVLFERILAVAGKNRKVVCPKRILPLVGKVCDFAHRTLPIPETEVNGAAIAMSQLWSFYCSGLAQRELNYHNRPSDETLNEAWQWLNR